MDKQRIAVLVSGGGTNLGALIDAEKNGSITSGKISLVISNKSDAYALTRAENAGIPSLVVPKSGRTQEQFEDELICAIDGAGCELIVLAGFMCILSERFTRRYENRIINVHPSLIPSFCGEGYYGLHVHRAALKKGVKVSGATVHFVTHECDAGPIILQKAVNVKEGDTPETLQKRIMEEAEWVILPMAVKLFCDGKLTVTDNKVYIQQK